MVINHSDAYHGELTSSTEEAYYSLAYTGGCKQDLSGFTNQRSGLSNRQTEADRCYTFMHCRDTNLIPCRCY